MIGVNNKDGHRLLCVAEAILTMVSSLSSLYFYIYHQITEVKWNKNINDKAKVIWTMAYFFPYQYQGGARGVMVIVTGYGHGDTSSIPGQDWLHFT